MASFRKIRNGVSPRNVFMRSAMSGNLRKFWSG
jgi:hypothetical protein